MLTSDPFGSVRSGGPAEARLSQTLKTDAAGTYQFINLPPAPYTIRVGIAGFKAYERHDLPVSTNAIWL